MPTYSDRARATVEGRRRAVFRAWLAVLPAEGWSGTAGDLSDKLTAFLAGHPLRFGTSFPTGAGVSPWLRGVADEIGAAGRQLRFTRTKRERLITIGPRG
ncbi:hypothetical protein [Urbifossiella limnaea]|uniref:Uncharacterized protein n=1 Tax=Urbifossiella limnaea TaxID=2528023 RepID=A0A517Y1C4_9BACT|nr:hypothetical protein [Urbifossiella limnaea]QDU23577.1 hypothetical protein ETAA1_55780 [Urbifossiella limnaea]